MSKKNKPPKTSTPDAYSVFLLAEDFRIASETMVRAIQNDLKKKATALGITGNLVFNVDPRHLHLPLAVPQVVVAALSSELFFKCLARLEGKPLTQIHELDALFAALDKTTQGRIRSIWDRDAAINPSFARTRQLHPNRSHKIEDCLRAASKAFVQFRYQFETNAGDFSLGNLPDVLRDVVYEMKPDWVPR